MAYVKIPKDMNKIESRLLFNLTKRQIICFSAAIMIGVPTFLLTRGALGAQGAAFLMMFVTMPAFFVAMYKKHGLPLERHLLIVIRQKWIYPAVRLYKNKPKKPPVTPKPKKGATPHAGSSPKASHPAHLKTIKTKAPERKSQKTKTNTAWRIRPAHPAHPQAKQSIQTLAT